MIEICSILAKNNYPLVRVSFDSTASIKLEVVPYAKGLPHISISDVWAQGLGNKNDNGLHAFQLHVRALVPYILDRWTPTSLLAGHPLLSCV